MTLEKKGLNFLVVLVVSLFALSSVSALIGSIGNARMILYPEVDGKNTVTIEKSILVKNVNDVPVNITLKVDETSAEFIEIVDETFILEPATEKKATFIIKVKKEGNYNGKIVVLFSPVSGKEAGVALPSSVVVIAKKDQGYSEEEENTEEEVDPITGEVIDGKNDEGNKKFNPVVFMTALTAVLLVVLVFLITLMNKKANKKSEGKKKNGK